MKERSKEITRKVNRKVAKVLIISDLFALVIILLMLKTWTWSKENNIVNILCIILILVGIIICNIIAAKQYKCIFYEKEKELIKK